MQTIKRIRIVLIDSGVDLSVDDMSHYVESQTYYYIDPEGWIKDNQDAPNDNMHGTSMALIIRDICPDASIISYKVLNERAAADSRLVLHAFFNAIALVPHIIHLSLGTTELKYKKFFKYLVRKAVEKNIITVSACHNGNKLSYPAFIKRVIRVKGVYGVDQSFCKYKKGIYYASSDASVIKGIDGSAHLLAGGNSSAAAFVTGMIARILTEKYQGSTSAKELISSFKQTLSN